jgi:hypothetical protein
MRMKKMISATAIRTEPPPTAIPIIAIMITSQQKYNNKMDKKQRENV